MPDGLDFEKRVENPFLAVFHLRDRGCHVLFFDP
jgi:hypothetical protein